MDNLNKRIIIGTAGHVDHGKSLLVKALTGTDPDRLKEEKEREMTIDIGFAPLRLTDNCIVPILDVPGHEDLIKNMLAAATGIDIVIFVIAANEGIQEQTIEHFDILNLLEIKNGIIALTKTDLVKKDEIDSVVNDIKDYFKNTFLEHAPLVKVSSVTSEGIAELKETIKSALDNAKPKEDKGVFRLPIDRVFTIKGAGTVVTGTLVSGSISTGEKVEILPQGKTVQIRGLQVLGEEQDEVFTGQRVALNLRGTAKDELNRGDVLCRPGFFRSTGRIDGKFSLLSGYGKKLAHGTNVILYHGTSETVAKVLLINRDTLEPGASEFVQLKLDKSLVVQQGDHYIIRTFSKQATMGGGTVIKTLARKHKRFRTYVTDELKFYEKGSAGDIIEHTMIRNKYTPQAQDALCQTVQLSNEKVQDILKELIDNNKITRLNEGERGLFIHNENFRELQDNVVAWLTGFHTQNPSIPGIARDRLKNEFPAQLEKEVFAALLIKLGDDNKIKISDNKVSLREHVSMVDQEQDSVRDQLEKILMRHPYKPPSLDDVFRQMSSHKKFRELWRLLLERGTIIKISEESVFHKNAIEQIKNKTRRYMHKNPEMKASDFRELLSTNRKNAIFLLEYLDRIGFTKRVGDSRILKEK
ncbi:selenocysteine-specific translation elongation factor [Spirochaetota bacterium]